MPLQGTNGFDRNDPLGCDLAWTDDLNPTHRLESGLDQLRHDIYGRITCPHGRLIDDPDYGFDVKGELLHKPMAPKDLLVFPRRVEAEIRKDERVDEVKVTLTQSDTYTFLLDIRGLAGPGPFRLVVEVTSAYARIVESA